jgi:acetyl esterase/lipase
MRDALSAAGVHVELFLAEGADHRFFERPWWQRPTLRVMEDFFARVLK